MFTTSRRYRIPFQISSGVMFKAILLSFNSDWKWTILLSSVTTKWDQIMQHCHWKRRNISSILNANWLRLKIQVCLILCHFCFNLKLLARIILVKLTVWSYAPPYYTLLWPEVINLVLPFLSLKIDLLLLTPNLFHHDVKSCHYSSVFSIKTFLHCIFYCLFTRQSWRNKLGSVSF